MKCSSQVYPSLNYYFADPHSWGYSSWWGRLDQSTSYPNLSGGNWFAFNTTGADYPATSKSPPGCAFIMMSNTEHANMLEAADVNQTLTIGLILLFSIIGFALGYYFMGPRRRSLVEVV